MPCDKGWVWKAEGAQGDKGKAASHDASEEYVREPALLSYWRGRSSKQKRKQKRRGKKTLGRV